MDFSQNAPFYLFRSVGLVFNLIFAIWSRLLRKTAAVLVFLKIFKVFHENLTSHLLSLGSRGVLVSNKARQKTPRVAVSMWLGGISGKGRDLVDFQRDG